MDELTQRISNIYHQAAIEPKDVAKFLLNEVQSVCNKQKVDISVFPHELLYLLLALRKNRALTNKKIRDMLVSYIEETNDRR